MELDKTTDQPLGESGDDNQPETNPGSDAIDLGNGDTVTLEELKSGYMKGKDYTKKTQELSKQKEELKLSDKELALVETFTKAGFATVDELANFKKEQADKEEFSNFAWAADLSETQLKMVIDLKKVNPDASYWDIAKDYWLIDEAKLNRVKGGMSIKWSSFALPKKEEPYKVDVTKAGYNPEQAAKVAKIKF